MTKAYDDRPSGPRIRKEEWVISLVTRIVGSKGGPGFLAADDTASDIILNLLNAGGFQWEEGAIIAYVQNRASYMVRVYLARQERPECEFFSNGEPISIVDMGGLTPANQEMICDAHMAERCLKAIPNRQREALEILCDGGNPIDVAEEMGITPWAAIALIKEGREYVDRVDPID